MQFEVIGQSVGDWNTDDKSTMMVQISAIPTNHDLVVRTTENMNTLRAFLIHSQVKRYSS